MLYAGWAHRQAVTQLLLQQTAELRLTYQLLRVFCTLLFLLLLASVAAAATGAETTAAAAECLLLQVLGLLPFL